MLQFNCPECEKLFETDDSYAGSQVICDKCGLHFYVPEMEDIDEVIVEYVDEKQVKKRSLKQILNRTNIITSAVIAVFFLLVGGFLYLRNERLAAEQMRQNVIAELEKELKKNATESLYKLAALRQYIIKNNYDRGQTFDKHLDTLEREYIRAVKMIEDCNYAGAEKAVAKGNEAADWLIENAPLRRILTQKFKDIAETIKKDGSSADDTLKKAYYFYSIGEFENARNFIEKYYKRPVSNAAPYREHGK